MIKTKVKLVFARKSLWRRAFGLVVLIALLVALAGVVEATRDHSNLLEQIDLAKTVTDSDALWLRNDLIWLHDYMPEWYAYIEQAKPFTLSVDQAMGEYGIAANAQCCDALGQGTITFGDHFGDMTVSSDAVDQTFEARRIEFLSTLIHEATHLRDRRSGSLSDSIDFTMCVQGERSAYGKESEFKRAVASLEVGGVPGSAELYRRTVANHFTAETDALNNNLSVLFCMAWQPSD